MASERSRPHSPTGTRLQPADEGGIYRIIIPSESRPGRAHELRVLYTGEAIGCTCEGHAAYLDYRATRHTPGTPLARRDCWHMEAAADLLAHHLDSPPADPGGGHEPAGGAAYDPDPGGVCPRCLGSGAMLDGGNRPYPCERCGGRGRVGPAGPLAADDLSGWGLLKRADPGGAPNCPDCGRPCELREMDDGDPDDVWRWTCDHCETAWPPTRLPVPPADPGGAALAAAQDTLDGETRAWTEPPELAGPTASEDAARDERERRYDESMANLYGD